MVRLTIPLEIKIIIITILVSNSPTISKLAKVSSSDSTSNVKYIHSYAVSTINNSAHCDYHL